MAKRDGGAKAQKREAQVEVHVTYFGGMYVDPGDLLRSNAARETMTEMNRILSEERRRRQAAEGTAPNARGTPGEQ